MGGAEHVAHGLQLDHKWAMVSPLDLGLAQDVELLDAMNRLRKHQKGLSHLLPTEPSDPLLMTALLKFAQSQSRMYSSLMEAQLTALDHCLIKSPFEAILGLLVLSSTPSVSLGSTVDPYNCIERAFILARKHGLEGIVEESRAHWANLRETWLAETRRKVGLWYGIVHRAAWIDFFTSPTLTQRYIQTPLSVLPPTASFDELLSPLYSESILLDLLRPIGQALFALKHASCYHTGLHDKLTEATKAFEFGLALWMTGEEQNSTPLLILTALIIKPFMYLRITTEAVTNMPSPLSPEPRLKYLFDLGHDIIQTSQQVVQYLTSFVGTSTPLDLSGLPAFLQTLLLLPYAAISQADKVDRTSPYHQDGVTTSSSADVDLVTYRQILVDMTPSAQSALRRIDGLTPHACWQEYRDLGSNPDDVPNFESWDALWVSGALAASSQFWFPPDAQWSTTTH
ncbi:hypothetical protein I316_06422 [Kwoniella heveanensis BCC8398]|uniref:Transcription factor domain-containing protein n=1 Tax=Kwoniella heveanensis BCC8398 TaxID=1296120 RepID=A0A1B9GL62_9TREE|nr:hypothetical protein I316_06422 [Kwoniella heveanensis BCC8398]